MNINIDNMSGRLLIAAPGLEDPNFSHTVVLICEHTKEGAFGLILNRILMNSFKPLLNAFDMKSSLIDMPVYYGGPVKPEQGYVLYSPIQERYISIKVSERLAVTASKEILFDIAEGKGPEKFMFALGFSGWAANQLEEELIEDSWIVSPLDYNIIFKVPAGERWKYAAALSGIELDRFINKSGNA
ncbi:MAG: YqgE/AlgH family protein [Nitrospirota bacterium]